MPRAGFSGGGDLSGLFGSIYSGSQATQKAIQDAADQDMQSQWDAGLVTDDVWLQYIATRITAETDPKRKQRWITAQRSYGSAIVDKQANFTYENGGPIGDLIAHYEARLGALVPNSNEYREVALTLNDAKDVRASKNLQTRVDAIQKKIDVGQASWVDLRTILKEARDGSTANSDLRKSLDGEIAKVTETIRDNKLEGTFGKLQYQYEKGSLSAGAYAGKLRNMAQQFKQNDTPRYYQLMQSANDLARSGGSGGGGGYSGGGGGGSSTPTYTKTLDRLEAHLNAMYDQVDAWEDGAKTYISPKGVKIALTPEHISELDHEIVGTLGQVAHVYKAKGDNPAFRKAHIDKTKYINDVANNHNTITADVLSQELIYSATARMELALANPDTAQARDEVGKIASDLEKFASGLTKTDRGSRLHAGARKNLTGSGNADKDPIDLVDPDLVFSATTLAQAMRIISTPEVSDADANAALVMISQLPGRSSGGHDSTLSALVHKGLEVNARFQGLRSGDVTKLVYDGKWTFIQMGNTSGERRLPDGSTAMVDSKQASYEYADGSGSVPVDGKATKLVTIMVDINGHPEAVQSVARRVPVAGFDALTTNTKIVLSNGTVIPGKTKLSASQLEAIERDGLDIEGLLTRGTLLTVPAIDSWQVKTPKYTDKYGYEHDSQTWVQDAATGLWNKGKLPIKDLQTNKYGYAILNDKGVIEMTWTGSNGVAAPYAGQDHQGAQGILDAGGISEAAKVKGRDAYGNITEADDPRKSYFDPIEDNPEDDKEFWQSEKRDLRVQAKLNSERQAALKASAANLSGSPDDRNANTLGRNLSGGPDDRINNLASSFGITLGGAKAAGGKDDLYENPSFLRPGAASGPGLSPSGLEIRSAKKKTAALPKIKLARKPPVEKDRDGNKRSNLGSGKNKVTGAGLYTNNSASAAAALAGNMRGSSPSPFAGSDLGKGGR